jgi:release factor glutamine methyltransferase
MNETELLFTEVLNCDRLSLYLDKDKRLDRRQALMLSSAFKKRLSGQPIQYILGKTEFMGLEFRVTPDVFIPRPETEILVEAVIGLFSRGHSRLSGLRLLDIGTGSGCIAVSLAKFLPGIKIRATDISAAALRVAAGNARLNKVKVGFRKADLFDGCGLQAASCDLIVSNPPYIPGADIAGLSLEVRAEPRLSLDGGGDGLDFYRRIISESPFYLKDGAFLAMEMGFSQLEAIKKTFIKSGNFEIINILKDYSDIDRVIIARKNNSHG